MTAEYILNLADPRATLPVAGGKGASLARLSAAGLPVPDGFCVTTAAYQDFVAAGGIQASILKTLEQVNPDEVSSLEAAEQTIQALILDAPVPGAIEDAISSAYAALAGIDPAVAVRSSATAEDLPGLSFAGQQETYLNIHGRDAVVQAVRRCWASLWTARAIGYRAQHGIASETLSLAVVVQHLVCAEAAGVMFTANPVNGRRGEAMLTAAWGLGETVVGGLVTPDTFTVEKASGQVLSREIAAKEVMTALLVSGTQEQPVPEELRNRPVLSDAQAAALTSLGARIECLYGVPMDIEWTWTRESGFAIVQARPITALPQPEPPVPPPLEWKLPDPKGRYARGSITDLLPDPLSPLFATLGNRIIDAQTRALFARMTGRVTWPIHNNFVIQDYAYVTVKYPFNLLLRIMLTGFRDLGKVLSSGAREWQEDAHPNYVRAIERWQKCAPREMRAADLLEGASQIFTAAVHTYNVLQSTVIPAAGTTEMLFTQVYNRLVKKPNDPPAMTFLLGFVSAPLRAEQALFDLAMWVRQRPGLVEFFSSRRGSQVALDLKSGSSPSGVDPQDWQALRGRLDAYLSEHGHTLYDLDFAKPVPADEPGAVLDTLILYVRGEGRSPFERMGEQQQAREQAAEKVLQRLHWPVGGWFRKTLTKAQKMAPLREDGFADLGLGYPTLRALLLELGRRLAVSAAVERQEDVFWLREEELRVAVTNLDQGEAPGVYHQIVAERRALWSAEKRITPPTLLPVGGRFYGLDVGNFGARTEGQAGNTIKGAGAYPGRVSGVARVLRGPQDFDQMRPGDVLVAAITTPAWTPLFAMASAIVTDIGGPLSHSSIVAREYGIPAVLGTGVATRRITSGQRITVDGTTGLVYLGEIQTLPGVEKSTSHG